MQKLQRSNIKVKDQDQRILYFYLKVLRHETLSYLPSSHKECGCMSLLLRTPPDALFILLHCSPQETDSCALAASTGSAILLIPVGFTQWGHLVGDRREEGRNKLCPSTKGHNAYQRSSFFMTLKVLVIVPSSCPFRPGAGKGALGSYTIHCGCPIPFHTIVNGPFVRVSFSVPDLKVSVICFLWGSLLLQSVKCWWKRGTERNKDSDQGL